MNKVRSLELIVNSEIKPEIENSSDKINPIIPAAFSYIKTYFEYIYFTGAGPFRFVYSGNCYIIKTNRIQKVININLNIVCSLITNKICL